jgi:Ca2+-binding EF-hand superfamily protein
LIYLILNKQAEFTQEVLPYIAYIDLKQSLDSLGFEAQNQTIYQMISDMDINGNVDFKAFLELMTSRLSDKDSRENVKKVFNLFDEEKAGVITIKNLRKIVRDLGENIDEHELQEMIDKADSNRDGLVTMDDFY